MQCHLEVYFGDLLNLTYTFWTILEKNTDFFKSPYWCLQCFDQVMTQLPKLYTYLCLGPVWPSLVNLVLNVIVFLICLSPLVNIKVNQWVTQ